MSNEAGFTDVKVYCDETPMAERVAKAIFDAMDIADGLDGTVAKRYARAAIEAMREPTDEMCEAADWQQQLEVNQYQRAIEAALASKPEPIKSLNDFVHVYWADE
jgi:hypothetical protein